ncbi:MAG: hypothetical protein O3C68_01170 [Proteobacteria bacterium]|nr:hypothetical protein [Pseudomonadota bacterium]
MELISGFRGDVLGWKSRNIGTLGFYTSSAFADLRFDRAMFLIGLTALLNIGIDLISRQVRQTLRLQSTPQGR